MFGGETNSLFLGPMDNVGVPYNGNTVPPMQFDDLGSNGGIMSMAGNNNTSLDHLQMKLSTVAPNFSPNKLPVTFNDGFAQDEGVQGRRMWEQVPVSTGLKLSYGEEEHNSSISSAGEATMINLSPLSRHDSLQMAFVRQNNELDQHIRMQQENLRKSILELTHRHTKSLLNALEKDIKYRMHEKDAEIESLNQKNRELVHNMRQIAMEAHSWQYKAKQNESLVNALRSNINQVLRQGAVKFLEGYDENVVDDTVSSCNLPAAVSELDKVNCKSCKAKEVSVLLLPCRHLCLCTDCEALIEVCPVCQVKKEECLEVFMS